jgi:plastocyanin
VKTPVSLIVILLLATAVQGAAVLLTPSAVYETTQPWQTIDINNYKASSTIEEVEVSSPSLTIIDAEDYIGWTTIQDSDNVQWNDGSIETNVKSAVFEYQVSVPNVTTNSTATITVSLDGADTTFNVSILNDATPPTITNIQPTGYAKANNPSHAVSATVIDAETSVTSVTYSFNDCANGTSTTVPLTKSNNTYSGTADFGAYDEGEKACYTITATNAPGEIATSTGELLFDGTAPSVSITSPSGIIDEDVSVTFTASDNIATTLECIVELDSTDLGMANASNGTSTTLNYNLSTFDEGSHTISVTCEDGVGLEATHAAAIILDKNPPTITLDAPSFIKRTTTNPFTAKVTDTIGLASVFATFEGSNVTLTQSGDNYTGSISSDTLGTETLEITAEDEAGHVQTATKTITVVPNHALTLSLSPSTANPGDTITASGTLTLDGSATEDDVKVKSPSDEDTVPVTNGTYTSTFTAPDTGTYTITTEYEEAGYTYTATATLTVVSPSSASQGYSGNGGSGIGADAWRTSGYVKPDEPAPETNSDTNAVIPDEPEVSPSTPAPTYEPLPPEEPREAFMPKATGIFSLGKAIKWLAILLTIALIGGLAVYGWSKRKKKEEGLNWNGYFKG